MPKISAGLRLLSSEVLGLQSAFYVLAISALLSSLLALLRDRLLAHTFGAGATLDLYYAAFRIPDLIFVGTGALVSVYILIPELARRSGAEQKDYLDTVIFAFALLAVVVSGTAAILAPFVLPVLFPQFAAAGQMPALVGVTRIMLLQPILLGLSNIFAAVTQSRSRYWLYSISPLLYNAGIIFGTIFFYPVSGLEGLAWGVVLGAALHASIQLPSIMGDGFFRRLPRFRVPRALLPTMAISVPRALALSMNQLIFIGLTAFAASLTAGSIAIFMFAYNLQAVPLAIVGASYSVAAFPTLARALSRGDRESFIAHIATAARYVFFWSLPAIALVIVLRAYIVRVILGSGQFDWTDTRLTAAALAVLSVSIVAQGLTMLLVRGYYAAGRTFIPFFIALGTAALTLGLAGGLLGVLSNGFILEVIQHMLRIADVPGGTVIALTFAYSAAAVAGSIILLIHFEHRFSGFVGRVRRAFAESCIAALTAGAGAYGVLTVIGPITLASTTLSAFMHAFVGGVFGIFCGAVMYALLGNAEFVEVATAVRARLFRISTPPAAGIVTSAEEGTPANPQ